jgi:RNA polymerase sigma-70 factor, ECF subfamily
MTAEELGEPRELLDRAADGDPEALRALFAGQRERLVRLVHLRLSRQVAGRLDEREVVEEIFAEARAGLRARAAGPPPRPSLSLWLRDLACRKLAEIHRRHLGTAGGYAGTAGGEELTLHGGGLPVADPASLVARLMGTVEDRSGAAARAEARIVIQQVLNSMEPIDREVLAMKHFERLDFREIAEVLGLSEAGVGDRYLGAIKRLKAILPREAGSRSR